jgi:hypothetical protein
VLVSAALALIYGFAAGDIPVSGQRATHPRYTHCYDTIDMNGQFYVARAGDPQRQGPFTREELEQGLNTGRFLASDLAWQTGTKEWLPIPSVVMPPVPDAPSVPGMPPLPGSESLPPPPPFDRVGPPAAPPVTGGRAPFSPLGLLALVIFLAGAGVLVWLLVELWDKYPILRAPLMTEQTIGWIAAAAGLLTLLVAAPLLSRKTPVRGRAWAVTAGVLGGILAAAGLAGGIFAEKWAVFRYDKEEDHARRTLRDLGGYSLMYARKNGGRFPNSLQEIMADDDAGIPMSMHFDVRGGRNVTVTPGLTLQSPGETVLLADSWVSGRNVRAVYYVNGNTASVDATLGKGPEGTPAGGPLAGFPGGAVDLSSPESTMNAILAAAKRGDIEGVRRCMTEKGFQKEFGATNIEKLQSEFGKFTAKLISQEPPRTMANGAVRMSVRMRFTGGGETDDETVIFEKRGSDWLLEGF